MTNGNKHKKQTVLYPPSCCTLHGFIRLGHSSVYTWIRHRPHTGHSTQGCTATIFQRQVSALSFPNRKWINLCTNPISQQAPSASGKLREPLHLPHSSLRFEKQSHAMKQVSKHTLVPVKTTDSVECIQA